ncbi:MAG TPA: hypothetical protein VHZ75_01315 [Solirubrobacteraceae bacterium]|nr:hypothetical protein [Solirubrobacteraceae bacterium]
MSDVNARLRAAVRNSGSPLGAVVGDVPAGESGGGFDPVALAAGGPRVAEHRDDVELAVAAVLEGCLLHYGEPRALRVDDPDLALLAGDRLYALGLARLAAIDDLAAIAELADIIALSAQAHAAGDGELALAAWHAGAAAIAWGTDEPTTTAKGRARRGDPAAAEALHAAGSRKRD